MALIKCKECEEEISKKAEKCPKCGAPAKKKTSLFTWLVLFMGIVWFIAYSSKPLKNSDSSIEYQAKVINEKAIQVNIKNILSEYKNNEVNADNKFKGKLIQTNGVIGDIKKDILGNLYITLGTNSQFEIPKIQAFFEDSQNNQLAKLNKGETLTVICRIEGLMMNILAKECVIK